MTAHRLQDLLHTLRRMLSTSICIFVLGPAVLPADAGTDASCLARVSKDAWKSHPLRLELEDGQRLVLDQWAVRTSPVAGIDTSGVWFGNTAPIVPASSIRRIDYDKRGVNIGGMLGGVALGIAGAALADAMDDADPPPPDFDHWVRVDTARVLGAVFGGILGYVIGTAVLPSPSERRHVECSPAVGEIAIHDANTAPSMFPPPDSQGVKP